MLSFFRRTLALCDFPRDLREEATLGLFLLLFVMSCAAIAMQMHIASRRPEAYTLECLDPVRQQRSTFYGCPSVQINSDHAWCGSVRVESFCSAVVQD